MVCNTIVFWPFWLSCMHKCMQLLDLRFLCCTYIHTIYFYADILTHEIGWTTDVCFSLIDVRTLFLSAHKVIKRKIKDSVSHPIIKWRIVYPISIALFSLKNPGWIRTRIFLSLYGHKHCLISHSHIIFLSLNPRAIGCSCYDVKMKQEQAFPLWLSEQSL
jgi:hypothetical protein